MDLKKFIIFLAAVTWPLSLLLSNNVEDSVKYLLPSLLILISYFYYGKEKNYFFYPLILIPFIDYKLIFLPLIFIIGLIIIKIKTTLVLKIVFIIPSILILIIFRQTFHQDSIFKLEYEARQEVVRNTHLYPNVLLARTFQNKGRIILNKFSGNFFALIDPGNYFFSFHPREGETINQNLVKFPFLAIIPIFIGVLEYNKHKHKKFIGVIFLTGIFSLSFVEIFDRSDLILWLPFVTVFTHGINTMMKSKKIFLINSFFVLFTVNTIIELIRIFFLYKT